MTSETRAALREKVARAIYARRGEDAAKVAIDLVLEEAARAVEPSNAARPEDWTEYARIKAECAATLRALKGKD